MTERIDIRTFERDLYELAERIAEHADAMATERQALKSYERDLEALSDRLMLDVVNELAGQRSNGDQRDAALRAKLRQHPEAKRLYAAIDGARGNLDERTIAHDAAVHRRQNLLAVLAYETAYLYNTAGLSALTRPSGR